MFLNLNPSSIRDIEGARSAIIMLLSKMEQLQRENEDLRTETRRLWNALTESSATDDASPVPLSEQDYAYQPEAPQSTEAAENAVLLEEVRRRAREAETLRLAGAAVAGALRQEEAIERILTQLRRVVAYNSASVQLLRDDCLEIVGGHGWDMAEAEVVGMIFPVPGINPNTIVIEERRPYILNDARSSYKAFRQPPHNHIQSWLGVPLIVHDRVIGMLAIDSNEKDHFTADHARLATAFADHVAIAVENAQLFEAERRRAEQIDALREIGVELTAELELDSLLHSIVEHAISLLDAPAGGFYKYRPQTDDLIWAVVVGSHLEPIGRTLKRGEGLSGKVLNRKRALIVNDYDEWDGRVVRPNNPHWTSLIGIPVQWGDEFLGVLNVLDRAPRTFTDDDAEKLSLLATQASIAMVNARLFAAEHTAREIAETLRNANIALTRTLDLDTVLEILLEYLHAIIPYDSANVSLCEEETNLASIHAVRGYDRWTDIDITNDVVFDIRSHHHLEHLVQSAESILISDTRGDPGWVKHLPGTEHVRSWLGVPLVAAGDVIGFFNLDKAIPEFFTEDHVRLAEAIAGQAAVAIQNARLFLAVKRMAIRDELTGLHNRRYFFEIADQEFKSARESERLCAIMIFDVDRFKHINDTYGHRIGDEVLRAVAKRLERCTRESDIAGRYGGEEFVVLQSGGSPKSTQEVAERIRRHMGRDPVATTRGLVPVTVSAGVAIASEDTPDLLSLLDRADAALYAAKRAGRDRTAYAQHVDDRGFPIKEQHRTPDPQRADHAGQ